MEEFTKEEIEHLVELFGRVKQALKNHDAVRLNELSNYTVHHSCTHQDAPSITIAVLFYTLSKIIGRNDHQKIKGWNKFVLKFNALLDRASKALEEDHLDYYEKSLKDARKAVESISVDLKPYIEEVLHKASINKGSRLYEHGISLGRAAKLLGVTSWELTSYVGQKSLGDVRPDEQEVKKRAKLALEFFE